MEILKGGSTRLREGSLPMHPLTPHMTVCLRFDFILALFLVEIWSVATIIAEHCLCIVNGKPMNESNFKLVKHYCNAVEWVYTSFNITRSPISDHSVWLVLFALKSLAWVRKFGEATTLAQHKYFFYSTDKSRKVREGRIVDNSLARISYRLWCRCHFIVRK